MATTDTGAIALASLMIGDGVITAFNAANAHIGVGDSATAFSAAQTDLQAVTNKFRQPVDGAPTRTSNSIDFVATVGTGDANFEWLEIGLFNALSGGTMATRKTFSLGTKTASQVWTITLTVVATAA